MNRCASPSSSSRKRWIALAIASAGALAALAPLAASARNFPATALRGRIEFTNPPDVLLNGDAARLSAAMRIHGLNNMLMMTGAIPAGKYVVDYTLDSTGLIYEIWMLSEAEIDVSPWPRTAAEAAAWKFDFASQTWTKP